MAFFSIELRSKELFDGGKKLELTKFKFRLKILIDGCGVIINVALFALCSALSCCCCCCCCCCCHCCCCCCFCCVVVAVDVAVAVVVEVVIFVDVAVAVVVVIVAAAVIWLGVIELFMAQKSYRSLRVFIPSSSNDLYSN